MYNLIKINCTIHFWSRVQRLELIPLKLTYINISYEYLGCWKFQMTKPFTVWRGKRNSTHCWEKGGTISGAHYERQEVLQLITQGKVLLNDHGMFGFGMFRDGIIACQRKPSMLQYIMFRASYTGQQPPSREGVL